MWNYEKRLQYPVKISQTNPQMAQVIISQFGGPDGELSASMRYLSQRYTMPYKEVTGILTDIGTEECARNCYYTGKSPYLRGIRGFSVSSKVGLSFSPRLFLSDFLYSTLSRSIFKALLRSGIDSSQ